MVPETVLEPMMPPRLGAVNLAEEHGDRGEQCGRFLHLRPTLRRHRALARTSRTVPLRVQPASRQVLEVRRADLCQPLFEPLEAQR